LSLAEAVLDPDVEYSLRTITELPRAASRSKEIAAYADFFSFGTHAT
jgi:phosphoenolpyruvate synthase/pyruvate phosphate dikinase